MFNQTANLNHDDNRHGLPGLVFCVYTVARIQFLLELCFTNTNGYVFYGKRHNSYFRETDFEQKFELRECYR